MLIKSRLSVKNDSTRFEGLGASSARSPARSSRIHGRSPDPLWWRMVAPPLLPTSAVASALPPRRALPATQQCLQHSGNAAGVVVSDHPGPRASRHDRVAAPKWGLPDTHWSARLSRSHGVAPIPPALRRPGIAEAPSPPRSAARGDVHTGSGTVWLLRACFAKMPPTVRQIRVRADAGFFDYKVIRAIEARRGKFVIVARLTPPLKRMIPGLRYTEVRPGLAVADCPYQPHGWPHPYRFVVVRKTLPEEESPQTTLFTVGRYSYHAFVTNLRIWPLAVYRLYNDRAAVELIIKELKADYPLAKIPTGPVCGQRGVLPSLAVRLQPDELVQAPLSASRVSFDDLGHTTPSPAHDSRGVRPCSPRPDPQATLLGL